MRLTQAHRRYGYTGLSILPSHFFIPEHFSGACYEGRGSVYARQHWASTRGPTPTKPLHRENVE